MMMTRRISRLSRQSSHVSPVVAVFPASTGSGKFSDFGLEYLMLDLLDLLDFGLLFIVEVSFEFVFEVRVVGRTSSSFRMAELTSQATLPSKVTHSKFMVWCSFCLAW